jgi:hypothetical protein
MPNLKDKKHKEQQEVDNIIHNKTNIIISKHPQENAAGKMINAEFIGQQFEKNKFDTLDNNRKLKESRYRSVLETDYKKSTEKTYEDYERQEKMFKLEQLKRKSIIRVADNRGQLFDKLLYLTIKDQPIHDCDITAFDGFEDIKYYTKKLEELKDVIYFLIEMKEHEDYWIMLNTICDSYIKDIKKIDNTTEIIQSEILEEVVKDIKKMGYKHLEELELEIKENIENGKVLNEEYWCALLPQLQIYKAKSKLNEMQEHFIKFKLEKLSDDEKALWTNKSKSHTNFVTSNRRKNEEYNNNNLVEEKVTDEDLLISEIERPKDEDEEVCECEFLLLNQDPNELGYIPRKPLYYNTVKKVYFWNPYNRLHFDEDNPPPKQIQGYKFNIFLANLENPKEPPHFVLEPCLDPDYEILRFVCGKPYSDVAFKIIKRDWQKTRRFGYKSCFANGVLQLWFNFKVYRWRR